MEMAPTARLVLLGNLGYLSELIKKYGEDANLADVLNKETQEEK